MVDVVGKFGSFVKGQQTPIEWILLSLILINWAPTEFLGSDLNSRLRSMFGPVMSPVKSVMSNIFVRFFLWLVLLWSCCWVKDMKLFFLISIYFLSVH